MAKPWIDYFDWTMSCRETAQGKVAHIGYRLLSRHFRYYAYYRYLFGKSGLSVGRNSSFKNPNIVPNRLTPLPNFITFVPKTNLAKAFKYVLPAFTVASTLLSVKDHQTCTTLYTQRRGGEMGRNSFPRPHAASYDPKVNWKDELGRLSCRGKKQAAVCHWPIRLT